MHKAEAAAFEGDSGGGGGVSALGEAVGQAAAARFEAVAEGLDPEGAAGAGGRGQLR
jgi:hypothetical protein